MINQSNGTWPLNAAARFWFLTAVVGQFIFVAYIAAFHGPPIAGGDWTQVNKTLPHGYEAGHTTANLILSAHLLFAAWITLSGAIQFTPQIRTRFPIFHRWNGRLYIATAFTMAFTGLYLTLSERKTVGDTSQKIAIIINALLILAFAIMALRTALARNFTAHRSWALRLFLVVSGVWFFRVGIMFWLFLHRAPVGFDPKTFTGPFLTALGFGQYLLPLAVLELYLRVQSNSARLATAALLLTLTLAMAAGIFAATMGMWLPRIAR